MRAMRVLTAFFFSYSLLTSMSAHAASPQNERTIREQCSDASEAGMHDCLEKKARESETALKDAERKTNDALGKWDEDAKYVSSAKTKLQLSNKAFERYREAQCAVSASLGGGAIGHASDMRRLACLTELNDRRAEQLRAAFSDLPMR